MHTAKLPHGLHLGGSESRRQVAEDTEHMCHGRASRGPGTDLKRRPVHPGEHLAERTIQGVAGQSLVVRRHSSVRLPGPNAKTNETPVKLLVIPEAGPVHNRDLRHLGLVHRANRALPA